MTSEKTMESCCTCATILDPHSTKSTLPYPSAESEKPIPPDRRLECCSRVICGKCIYTNYRFSQYCPYCQVTSGPSSLPQGLRDPPSYTALPPASSTAKSATDTVDAATAPPPPYIPSDTDNRFTDTKHQRPTAPSYSSSPTDPNDEKAALAAASLNTNPSDPAAEDTLHFLNHNHDSIASLSLRYNVPAPALRRANNLTSDHLLLARRTILIPGEFYKAGVSLSPRPIEGEDEELRKSKIRRFMTSAKVSDYDMALLYLEQAGYDLAAALEAFFADEAWERENPNGLGGAGAGGKYKKTAKAKDKKSRVPFWRGL